jgi:hypothetical protein
MCLFGLLCSDDGVVDLESSNNISEMNKNDWQPMDAAPKDGRTILVWRRGKCDLAHWDDNRYAKHPKPFWGSYGIWGSTSDRGTPPAAWQPLPEPPLDLPGK